MLITPPCGAPDLRISEVEMLFPTFTTRGEARQKVQDPIEQAGVETLGLKLNDELEGTMVLNVEL